MTTKITISYIDTNGDKIWAGEGEWSGAAIENCAADLGSEVYEAIEEAVTGAGHESGGLNIDGTLWRWELDSGDRQRHATIEDARTAMVNSGVVEMFDDYELEVAIRWMYENDYSADAAAEAFGVI